MKKIYFFIFSIWCNSLLSQYNSYSGFRNVESICYCNVTASTPESIVGIDNNWEIVKALMQPKSLSGLDSTGIKYNMSQLMLLEQWSIISKSDSDIYKTSIVILDSTKTTALRQFSGSASKTLSKSISGDVINLKNILKNSNRERNIYSILFSYVLDGMVWDLLNAGKLLTDRELSIEKPYWNGEFWITFPKREFYCGTNSISDSGFSLKVNWSEKSIPKMLPFVNRWDLLGKILDNLISKGKVGDKNALEVFKPFNIFDDEGNFTVPIIIENDNNPLYKISQSIASKITLYLKNEVEYDYLVKQFGFKNKSQAIIILYHEILWDILDVMESDKLISKPIAFSNPENSKAGDISDLVFITEKIK